MNLRRINVEILLYGLAVLIALSLRFYNLGAAPLTDEEARWTLQAYRVAKSIPSPEEIVIGPQPAYIFLTATLFRLFGTSNFLARFCTALAGTALVLTPAFFRVSYPRIALIILVFGLSLDPGLVTVSRQAASPILAISCVFIGVGAWVIGKKLVSGIFLGIATLSGPAFYAGAIGLFLAAASFRRIKKQSPIFTLSNDHGKSEKPQISQPNNTSLQKFESK